MKENVYLRSIEEKIFDAVYIQQTGGLLLHGKPLMNNEDLAMHIENNINSYLSEEEIDNLIIRNIGSNYDEKLKNLVLDVLVQVAALKVNQAINTLLLKMDGGDNPYSVFTQPKEFMLHKFMKEQMGLQLTNSDLSKLLINMRAINN